MGRARVRFGPFSFDTRTGVVIGSYTYNNLQQVDTTGGELLFSSLGGDVFAPSLGISLPLAVEEDARNAALLSSTADQFVIEVLMRAKEMSHFPLPLKL